MKIRVGVTVPQQHADYKEIRSAWAMAEELGADVLFNWDHFFPLTGDADGKHFESMTLLAAMAEVTDTIEFGSLVLCNSYRNPQLLADATRTIDHISGGRHILGIGSGWFEKDYTEYGYEFGTAIGRLHQLDANLPIIKDRLQNLNPPPTRRIPMLIGGGGEKVTLRIVAENADIWNGVGSTEEMAHKNKVLDQWCEKVGRDPAEIERSAILMQPEMYADLDGVVDAGITLLISGFRHPPYDFGIIKSLLEYRDRKNAAA